MMTKIVIEPNDKDVIRTVKDVPVGIIFRSIKDGMLYIKGKNDPGFNSGWCYCLTTNNSDYLDFTINLVSCTYDATIILKKCDQTHE